MDAIDTIRQEHTRIATVLHCLDRLAERMTEEEAVAELSAFEAILDYLQTFPERFHHPKENEYLFAVMKDRAPDLAPIIDRLMADHADGERRLTDLTRALEKVRAGKDSHGLAFRERVAAYVAFEREHMKTEETMIMPRARAALSAAEMTALQEAFSGNTDPLFGKRQHHKYDALYSHLLDVVPLPEGFAPSWKRPVEETAEPQPVPTVRRVVGHI